MHVLRFLAELRRTACEPTVFRRCGAIALVVGTLLTVVNHGDAIVAGSFDRVLGLRILGNYLIPFVVGNLGTMAPRPPREDQERRPR